MIILKNDLFKKICGNIDYNTYTNLQGAFCISTIGLATVNQLIPQYPLINNYIDILTYATFAAFLNNYNKLNKIFDLSNPIEIYIMFNYLLYKGYLSKNKEFQYSDEQRRNLRGLFGVEVITGKVACRHISCMLTDILNEYKIESYKLGVHMKDYVIAKQQAYTKEEFVSLIDKYKTDEENYEFLMKLVDELADSENIEVPTEAIIEENMLKNMITNHIITFAYKDGRNYFLDPTNAKIYWMNDDSKKTLYGSSCIDIPIHFMTPIILDGLDGLKNYLQIKKHLSSSHLSTPLENEYLLVNETLDKCNNNIDIFEQFYVNNCELYDDITSKVLHIRKI